MKLEYESQNLANADPDQIPELRRLLEEFDTGECQIKCTNANYIDVYLGKAIYLSKCFTKSDDGLYVKALEPDQVERIMSILQSPDLAITKIDMSRNKFHDETLRVIINNLPKGISELDLGGNDFGKLGMDILGAFAAEHRDCKVIAIGAIRIDDKPPGDFSANVDESADTYQDDYDQLEEQKTDVTLGGESESA